MFERQMVIRQILQRFSPMINKHLTRRAFLASTAGMTAGLSALPGLRAFGADKRYEPSFESLDRHGCPNWYLDSKIGLYYHWGVCSVPGWAPRISDKEIGGGTYAEWYWHAMNNPSNPTYRYHRESWGEDFEYDDFIPLFKASDYDAGEWIRFAKAAGAKYVFCNTKHHDGFCHWPSKYTNRNASKMGPCRDLIRPFVTAARAAGLKVGFYYSFYEWYNPLYTGKPCRYDGLIEVDDYVDGFMVPQVRELIDLYTPDFIYFDGEWDHPPEFWKSRELVAYYYNQALYRGQDVLVNDRFGKYPDGSSVRGHHGDVYNVEYKYGAENIGLLTHPWSYWQGIAKTFGWNRDTDPEDCLTPKELIHMAVDGVARNGNFDINVGPTADGIIPAYEQYPLLALGDWLSINGEAIYGTRPWTTQTAGDIRFTVKENILYAILLKWQGETIRVPGVTAVPGSDISMLGIPGTLDWRQGNDGITASFPRHRSRPTENAYAWSLKIRIV